MKPRAATGQTYLKGLTRAPSKCRMGESVMNFVEVFR
jgi:hypothetical protein